MLEGKHGTMKGMLGCGGAPVQLLSQSQSQLHSSVLGLWGASCPHGARRGARAGLAALGNFTGLSCLLSAWDQPLGLLGVRC